MRRNPAILPNCLSDFKLSEGIMPKIYRRVTCDARRTLALGLVVTLPNIAILSRATAQQINCQNPTSNVEYKECARRSYEAADRRLNQVYQQLSSKLSAVERKQLIDTETTWIQFRDKNCSFEVYPSRGGTGYGGFLSSCLEQMTKQRTADLERYLRR
jgi:uncharacterized protein YecT (DUF1311 family)